jgi:hypothetical protein
MTGLSVLCLLKKRWSECGSLQLRKREVWAMTSGYGAAIVCSIAAVEIDADDL